MQVVSLKKELNDNLEIFRQKGNSIGFVPTMGALHNGHRSLLKRCKIENGISICSIFVNPTQFNDNNDLKNYPRTLEKDLKIIEEENFDYVFVPGDTEMYPEPDTRIFEFGGLDEMMEGKHRPGHFNGVAQIVTKLFDAVAPSKAYFGEKDFQQLAIIKFLVRNLNLGVKIISCPIIREADGLAMSSRNLLLPKQERESAPLIYKVLREAVEMQERYNVPQLKTWVVEQINKSPFLKVEYFEIVNDLDLKPVSDWSEVSNKFGCIAVKTNTVRLIDNVRFG